MDHHRDRRPEVYFTLLLVGVLGLAAFVGYFELARRTEIEELRTKIRKLEREIYDRLQNLTETISSARVPAVEEGEGDEYSDYYDYSEDDEETRKKRSLGSAYKVHITQKHAHELKPANWEPNVKAKISILSDDDYFPPNNYEREHKFTEDRIVGNNPKDFKPLDEHNRGVALHFESNTSKFRHIRPPHYHGNHRMYHPQGKFRDWSPAHWVEEYGMDSSYDMDHEGVLTVEQPGIYYIYSQIFYADNHDTCGYRIEVNGKALFQCSISSSSFKHNLSDIKKNSCYTGGLTKLEAGDIITLREVEGTRYTFFEHPKSFFGLFRIAHP